MLRLRRLYFQLLTASLLFASLAISQETRGGIFGHVTDATSSAVARAAVIVKNTDTNVATSIVTNDSGYYDAPLLVAGKYQVMVEAPGFKKAERAAFDLPVGARLEVNFKLEVGSVSDAVTVTAEAPLINADSLTSGVSVDSKSVLNLPWPGGNSVVLAMLTVGVQDTDTISDYSVRLHSGGPGLRAIAYGGVGGNEYSVDGTSTNANNRANGFNPAPELVQAVNISTSAFDAAQGHSTGITIALQTRAGTNQYHGSLREGHHQYAWNALDFFTKQAYYTRIAQANAAGNRALADDIRSKPALSPGRENQYAGSFGGPVWIPKLFNGKNKLFFFFGYAGFRVGEYRGAFTPVVRSNRGESIARRDIPLNPLQNIPAELIAGARARPAKAAIPNEPNKSFVCNKRTLNRICGGQEIRYEPRTQEVLCHQRNFQYSPTNFAFFAPFPPEFDRFQSIYAASFRPSSAPPKQPPPHVPPMIKSLTCFVWMRTAQSDSATASNGAISCMRELWPPSASVSPIGTPCARRAHPTSIASF
jgi:hypothetical protein